MAIEQARVGEVAAQMMEILDQYGYAEDAEITDIMIVVAVDHNNGAENRVHWSTSPHMHMHTSLGLLMRVQLALGNNQE